MKKLLMLVFALMMSCEHNDADNRLKEIVLKTEDIVCDEHSDAAALKDFASSESFVKKLNNSHPEILSRVSDMHFDSGVDGDRFHYTATFKTDLTDVEIELLRNLIKDELLKARGEIAKE